MAEANGKFKIVVTGDGLKIDKEIDGATALQVMELVYGGTVPGDDPGAASGGGSGSRTATRSRRRATGAKSTSGAKRKPGRRAASPGIVGDLNLRPSDKKAFKDFAEEKNPATHQRKQTVIVYWLRHEAGMTQGITPAHVNTCYENANWKRPKDLDNSLAVTASEKGWIDTSDMQNIIIRTLGEDLVKHELPKKKG